MSASIPIYGRSGVVARALVDDADADLVNGYRWRLLPTGYAFACKTRRGPTVYMHRLVLGLEAGDSRQADHINRDRLDNRRENLRACAARQNGQNKPSYRDASSAYRGVTRRRNGWVAKVELDGVAHHLGTFTDEIEAARVAARFRAEHMAFSVEDPALMEQAA